MRNADVPAMPIIDTDESYPLNIERYGDGLITGKFASGLTKREEFAKFMMGSLVASGGQYQKWEHLAQDAIAMTDALLAELERTK